MAVDTAAKRFSMMAFGRGPGNIPIPDGTIAAADRAHLLRLYGGIALAGAPVSGPYTWEAGEVYIAGMAKGEVYRAGLDTGEVYIAGSDAGEVI